MIGRDLEIIRPITAGIILRPDSHQYAEGLQSYGTLITCQANNRYSMIFSMIYEFHKLIAEIKQAVPQNN